MKISAITPTFNRASFLLERKKELMKQTYTNWEWIIVDDCSTDNTKEIVDKIKEELGDKVKYIKLHKNSKNVTIPRNIGISRATGDFIAPSDDDVYSYPNKFEVLVSPMIKDSKIVLTYGNRYTCWFDGYSISKKNLSRIVDWNPLLINGWGVDNGQMLYRKLVYRSIPYVFCNRACDWNTAREIVKVGKIKHVDNIVSIYIWHNKNRSLDSSTKTRRINIDEYLQYFNKDIRFIIKEE
jgi:glycosyltransferase involved in cell wall biosynthesis